MRARDATGERVWRHVRILPIAQWAVGSDCVYEQPASGYTKASGGRSCCFWGSAPSFSTLILDVPYQNLTSNFHIEATRFASKPNLPCLKLISQIETWFTVSGPLSTSTSQVSLQNLRSHIKTWSSISKHQFPL